MNFDFNRIQGKKSYADDTMSTLRMNVTKNPDKTAVIFGDQGLKWRELWERSNRLANGLKGLGMNQNERVIIFLPNCMEYPEAILGINKAGLVACGTNVRLTGPEVVYQLNDSGARAIILKGVEQLELIMGIRGQVPDLEHIIMVDDASEGAISYGELLSKSSGEEPEALLAPDDVHLLMYTSGTTGKPKAAARTCKSDYHMANAVCHELGLTTDDVYLAVAPMYAAASMGYVFATMMSGGTLAIVPAFVPDQVFGQIEKYKATWIFMVPIMYEWMLSLPPEVLDAHDVSSVRSRLLPAVRPCTAPPPRK